MTTASTTPQKPQGGVGGRQYVTVRPYPPKAMIKRSKQNTTLHQPAATSHKKQPSIRKCLQGIINDKDARPESSQFYVSFMNNMEFGGEIPNNEQLQLRETHDIFLQSTGDKSNVYNLGSTTGGTNKDSIYNRVLQETG